MSGSAPVPSKDAEPLVTVGVFAFNHRDYVVEAAGSVVASTFASWELYVVDDGSSDGTAEVLSEWAAQLGDPRVRVVSDGLNRGLAVRLNQVSRLARGRWLAVLGGDDMYLPDGLSMLVSGIEPGVDVIWGDLEVIDESGAPKGYARPRDTWQGATALRYATPGSPGNDILRVNNFVSGTSPLIRLASLADAGGYLEGVRNEDLDLWLRMGKSGLFKYVAHPVARYRVVPGSNSRSESAAVEDQARIVARLLEGGEYSRAGLARLLAMRWILALARTKGRRPVSLARLSEISGLRRGEIVRRVPRAGLDPVALSAVALFRRGFGR